MIGSAFRGTWGQLFMQQGDGISQEEFGAEAELLKNLNMDNLENNTEEEIASLSPEAQEMYVAIILFEKEDYLSVGTGSNEFSPKFMDHLLFKRTNIIYYLMM